MVVEQGEGSRDQLHEGLCESLGECPFHPPCRLADILDGTIGGGVAEVTSCSPALSSLLQICTTPTGSSRLKMFQRRRTLGSAVVGGGLNLKNGVPNSDATIKD